MSNSSDNPIRQARRRGWAQKILPPDEQRAREKRQSALAMSHEEVDEVTQIWLAGIEAGERDRGTRDFFKVTFGPWTSQLLRLRGS